MDRIDKPATEIAIPEGGRPGPESVKYETYYDSEGQLRSLKSGKPFGRVKGTQNKITGAQLLEHLAQQTGRPYGEQLAVNYKEALDQGDKNIILKYDTLILNKVISDRIDVTVGQDEDQLAAKNAAFMAALAVAGGAAQRRAADAKLPEPPEPGTIDIVAMIGKTDQDPEE